ncbi:MULTISPECIES: hypothetical protein [unclassified Streptomyces]|uniref:hypothetical protein n=1 Tax=unclassified Streptomyces TaxID=2593676 RepID=UPI00362D5B4B
MPWQSSDARSPPRREPGFPPPVRAADHHSIQPPKEHTLALIDDADVFFGSDPDGTAYAVLHARLPRGRDVLLTAGFRPVERDGRTYYVQPRGLPYDEAKDALISAYSSLAELTTDIVDLTTLPADDPAGHEVCMTVTGSDVAAHARTEPAATVLRIHGFRPCTMAGQEALRLPDSLTDREKDRALVRAEAHLNAVGVTVAIRLGPPHASPPGLPAVAAPAKARTTRAR